MVTTANRKRGPKRQNLECGWGKNRVRKRKQTAKVTPKRTKQPRETAVAAGGGGTTSRLPQGIKRTFESHGRRKKSDGFSGGGLSQHSWTRSKIRNNNNGGKRVGKLVHGSRMIPQ